MNPDAFRLLSGPDPVMMESLRRRQQGGGFEPSALIAEGGGLGGAMAGGATGAAIGSVVPGIGTLIGGLIGAGVGGFVGGTGGSAVEQKVRDGSVDWKKAVKTGAIEGVTSAGPIKLIKAGKAAYAAKKAGGAVAPAVKEAIDNTLLKRMSARAGKSLEQTGGKLMNSQTNLTRATMRQIGANTPEMFMQMNSKYGLSKLDDVAAVSRNVTGQNGMHSEAVRNVLFSGPGIDTSDLRGTVPAILDKRASLVDGATRKRIQAQVDNSIQSMYADRPLSPLADPAVAFDISKDFRNQARQLRTGASPSGAEKQLSKVYDDLAVVLEKKLYAQPGLDQVFPVARDNMVKSYQSLASEVTGAQRRAYLRLAEEAAQMKTITDLRHAQKIWVEAAQVDQKTSEAAGNAATKLSGGGGVLSRAGNAILDAANPHVGAITARTGRMVSEGGPFLDKLNNTTTRAVVGAGTASALTSEPAQGDLMAQVNSTGTPPVLSSPQALLNSGPQPQQQQPAPPVDINALAATLAHSTDAQEIANALNAIIPNQGDELSRRLKMDMLLTGGQNAEMLQDIYGGGTQNLSTAQQKGVLAMQNAMSQVDMLEQLFSQAGGGQGRIMGALSGVTGRVGMNAEANAYRQKRAGAATLIARALGESGTMTDQDIKRAVDQIPDITDTPQEAQIKWQSLRQILSAIGQNTLSTPGASTGTDLLAQMNGM